MSLDRRYIVAPIHKSMQLLDALVSSKGTMTLSDLAASTALPKTTAFRYLYTLRASGFVSYDERTERYAIGPRVSVPSPLPVVAERIREIAQPAMLRLQRQFNETVREIYAVTPTELRHRGLQLWQGAGERKAQEALGLRRAEVAPGGERHVGALHHVEAEVPARRRIRRTVGPGVKGAVGYDWHGQAQLIECGYEEVTARLELGAAAGGGLFLGIGGTICDEEGLSQIDLGNHHVTVLYEYPACEAALARTCAHDARVAERFELYACGVELANGFGELTDAAEQRRRFKEREGHPLKQWKLSPIDKASLDKWDDYTRAKEAMFFDTDTADSPWTVIKSDCKKRARLNAMRYVLHKLPYANKDLQQIGKLDPLIVGRAHVVYERGENPNAIL